MKFSVKLIAAALCAAMLCVPALAAASATGAGAYVPNPQYTVISGTVAHQKDGGLLMSTSTGEPTEDYILWTEGVMILDAVSGEPVDAKSIKDGSTVYAWLGAQTAMTMSLPPQVTPELLLVNVPADYKVPQYDVIVRATVIMAGIPHYSGMDITLSDGTAYQVWEDAQITPSIVLETENIETVLALAGKGMGITFYPKMFMSGTGLMTDLPKNKKGLNFYSLPKGRTHGILAFGYHKGRYLSQATEEFIRIARENI